MIKRAFCVMLICLLLTLWTAGSIIPGLARDERLLLNCFDHYAQTEAFGVEKADYPLFAAQLSAYFRHETDEASVAQYPFHDYEETHLSDVRKLLDGVYAFAQGCLIGAAGGCALAVLLHRRRRFSPLPGFIAFLALAAIVILLAALHFDWAFYLLHELLFTNDLWLLNPETDLLIALMPEGMFMYLARRVLHGIVPLFAAMLLIVLLFRKFIQPRQKT